MALGIRATSGGGIDTRPLRRLIGLAAGADTVDVTGPEGREWRQGFEVLQGQTVSVVFEQASVRLSKVRHMLLLNVDRWLKKPTDMEVDRSVYVSYPAGRMEIAGVSACRGRGEELPPPPPAASSILAMFYGGPHKHTTAGDAFFYGHGLIYDGHQDGRPTLMASDALLRGSPEWLIDATVAELAERADRIFRSPEEYVPVDASFSPTARDPRVLSPGDRDLGPPDPPASTLSVGHRYRPVQHAAKDAEHRGRQADADVPQSNYSQPAASSSARASRSSTESSTAQRSM